MTNPIRAVAADGSVHIFESGTPDAVVDKVMKEYHDNIANDPTAYHGPEKPSTLVSIGRGAEDVGGGLITLGERMAGALGADSMTAKADERVQQNAADNAVYEAGRGPNAGIDIARGVGAGAMASPALLIPGMQGTVLRSAAGGALQGGVVGAAEAAGEGKSIPGGAATGAAVGGPLGAVGHLVGAGVIKLAGSIARYVADQVPQASIHDVLNAIRDELGAHGIDFDGLHQDVKAGIQQQVQTALEGGKAVDPAAAARLASFRQVGIEPTLGQVTQEPTQFSREALLRNTNQPLAEQYTGGMQALQQGIRTLQDTLPESLTAPEAGARVLTPLKNVAQKTQEHVGEAYDKFTAAAPESFKMNGADVANRFFRQAERNPGLRNLPKSLQGMLNDLSTGKVPDMTLADADAINHEISLQLTNATAAEKFSLNTLKRMIDDEVDSTVKGMSHPAQAALETMQDSGNIVDRLYAARSLAAQRFKLMEDVPALEAAAGGKIAPDDFIQKYVTGASAKVQDIQGLKDLLGKVDPGAWQQVRAQVLANLNEAATKGAEGKFLQNQFNTELRSLEKSGKLEILFGPDEINQLRTIGHVGRLMQEGPQGQSYTGFGGAAHAQQFLLDIISKMSPKVAAAARLVSRGVKGEMEARRAMRPSIETPAPEAPAAPAPSGLLERVQQGAKQLPVSAAQYGLTGGGPASVAGIATEPAGATQ